MRSSSHVICLPITNLHAFIVLHFLNTSIFCCLNHHTNIKKKPSITSNLSQAAMLWSSIFMRHLPLGAISWEPRDILVLDAKALVSFEALPSLKLTWHLKMDG